MEFTTAMVLLAYVFFGYWLFGIGQTVQTKRHLPPGCQLSCSLVWPAVWFFSLPKQRKVKFVKTLRMMTIPACALMISVIGFNLQHDLDAIMQRPEWVSPVTSEDLRKAVSGKKTPDEKLKALAEVLSRSNVQEAQARESEHNAAKIKASATKLFTITGFVFAGVALACAVYELWLDR